MLRIPVAEPSLSKKELQNVTEAVKSTWISSKGKFITEFEKKFSSYCNTTHGISTSNGTTALHLALKTLGIKEGDEVIVPNLTFAATINVVIHCNAQPVLTDIHSDYWGIDPEDIKEKINEKTKAIIPVHLYGHPCDMDPIMEIAKKHNLYVIEDAAEAHGAEYKGKKVGGIGDIGCFSFFGNKVITTGEGGMCVTNNQEYAKKMDILKNHGMKPDKQYWHEIIGYNYRMTNLQAAIGVAQLEKIDEFIEKKRNNAQLYASLLKDSKNIITPMEMPWAKSVFWMYSILIQKQFGMNTTELHERLLDQGIDTRPLFYPVNIMPLYKTIGCDGSFPVSEKISREGISLPSSVTLKSKDIYHICKTIKELEKQ